MATTNENQMRNAIWDYVLGLSPNNPQYKARVISERSGKTTLCLLAENGQEFIVSVKEVA